MESQENMPSEHEAIDLMAGHFSAGVFPEGAAYPFLHPYVLLRLGKGLIAVLGIDTGIQDDEKLLEEWCRQLQRKLNYSVCLVYGHDDCTYFLPNNKDICSKNPPSGGTVIHWDCLCRNEVLSVALSKSLMMFVRRASGWHFLAEVDFDYGWSAS